MRGVCKEACAGGCIDMCLACCNKRLNARGDTLEILPLAHAFTMRIGEKYDCFGEEIVVFHSKMTSLLYYARSLIRMDRISNSNIASFWFMLTFCFFQTNHFDQSRNVITYFFFLDNSRPRIKKKKIVDFQNTIIKPRIQTRVEDGDLKRYRKI